MRCPGKVTSFAELPGECRWWHVRDPKTVWTGLGLVRAAFQVDGWVWLLFCKFFGWEVDGWSKKGKRLFLVVTSVRDRVPKDIRQGERHVVTTSCCTLTWNLVETRSRYRAKELQTMMGGSSAR